MKLLREQRGQSTIILALSLTSLCGLAGFAVDIGALFNDKRILQTAADTAAIAGAAELNYGDMTSAADAATALDGLTNGANGVTVAVNDPPLYGPNAGVSGYVEVVVSQVENTYFMRVFGINTMAVSARAVGGLGAANGCIYTLGTTGKDIDDSGSSVLTVPGCGIVVDSSSSNAITLSGSSSIQAGSIGIAGGIVNSSSGVVSPTPVTGTVPVTNPLGFLAAPTFVAASCLADPHVSGTTTSLGPAVSGGAICYNGLSVNGAADVTLKSGLYIINGNFNVNASAKVTGTAVTIYLPPPNASVSLTGSGALTISAPTSGTYNGILFFQDPTDTQTLNITGAGTSVMSGIFYAPNAQLKLTGSSTATFNVDLVVGSISLTGPGSLNSYATVNSNSPLSTAVLVE